MRRQQSLGGLQGKNKELGKLVMEIISVCREYFS